jgi:methylmalonyl-CoA mutase cobalamin-binding subunit
MEYITAALAALGVGAGMAWRALWPVLRASLEAAAAAAAQRAMLALQDRLAGGASRVAGELAARARAAGLGEVPADMIEGGVAAFQARYAESLAEAKAAPDTPLGMILGELGKLGMPAVRR